MRLTSLLFKMARVSADANAIRRGPAAVAKRAIRKGKIRGLARTNFFRNPK